MELILLLEDSLKKGKITQELLDGLEKSKEKSIGLKNTLKSKDRTITSLKLYSAARTCEETLEAVIKELTEAKNLGENPTTLERLSTLIFYTDDLLKKTEEAISNSADAIIKILRKDTFKTQEEAERLGIIDKIEERAKGLKIRDVVVSKIEETI